MRYYGEPGAGNWAKNEAEMGNLRNNTFIIHFTSFFHTLFVYASPAPHLRPDNTDSNMKSNKKKTEV